MVAVALTLALHARPVGSAGSTRSRRRCSARCSSLQALALQRDPTPSGRSASSRSRTSTSMLVFVAVAVDTLVRCRSEPPASAPGRRAGVAIRARSRVVGAILAARSCSPPLLGRSSRSTVGDVATTRRATRRRRAPTSTPAVRQPRRRRARRAAIGEAAPDFDCSTLDGARPSSLSDYRGTPGGPQLLGVVVPSVRGGVPAARRRAHDERPDALRRARRSAPRTCARDAVRFADRLGVTYPALFDARRRRSRTATASRGIPQTFFIDADGVVRDRVYGITTTALRSTNRSPTCSPSRPDAAVSVTPPSGSSGRRASGARDRPDDEHDELAGRERAAGVEHRPHASPTARPPGSSLGERLERVGQLVERVGHAAEEQQHEEQRRWRRARFASARSVPAMSMPMPANAIVPSEQQPERGDDAGRRASQPSAMPVATISDGLDDLEREHVRASSPRAGRRATAASTRAASARRSAARSRSRCRGSPSRSTSPRARARRARGSRPGPRSRSLTASTLEKNTRMPSGIASVTSRLSPRRSVQHQLDAGLRGDRRRASRVRSVASAVSREEHVFERSAAGAQLARGATSSSRSQRGEVGDERGRAAARATTYSPGRVLAHARRRRARAPSASAATVEAGRGRERDLVGGRRAWSARPACRSATRRPWSMIATRSQSCSASSMRVRREHDGDAARRAARGRARHVVARACGSMPAVGSSRNTHVGPADERAARATAAAPARRTAGAPACARRRRGRRGRAAARGRRGRRSTRRRAAAASSGRTPGYSPPSWSITPMRGRSARAVAHGIEAEHAHRRRRRARGSPRGSRRSWSCPRRSARAGRRPRRRAIVNDDAVDGADVAVALLERGDLDRGGRRIMRPSLSARRFYERRSARPCAG